MTENDIIKGCLKKNATSQHLLFHQYSRQLMSVCLRYSGNVWEAEDMLQEAFIRIFAFIHQYKFKGSFEGWIRSVTVNTCLRKLEKLKIKYDDISTIETLKDTIEPNAISALAEKELIRLISNLPDGYRIVFNLNVIEGYSHNEIAAMLGIAPVTSRSQLIKARRLLQKQIISHQKIAFNNEG